MLQLLIAIALLAGLILLLTRPDAATLRRWRTPVLLWGGLGLLALLLVTGRLHWIFALIGAAVPLLRYLLPLVRAWPWVRWLLGQRGAQRAGEQGRQGERDSGNTPAGPAMTREEACAILDVPADADEATIVQAHRRLMQRLHPDRGGSSYLASRINAAKQRLLEGR